MSDSIITFEYKKHLLERIEAIKIKKVLHDIYDIVSTDSNLNKTINKNGIFIHFNNLHDETYIKLQNYLDKLT